MGSPAASIFAAGPGQDRRVALTFDDGPAASTEAVLDVLSAEDAPATFFIIGGFMAGREPTLQRARAAGHELGVHGLNHFNALLMREPETLSHELSACADELERAVGERPQLVRPPFGGDAGPHRARGGETRARSGRRSGPCSASTGRKMRRRTRSRSAPSPRRIPGRSSACTTATERMRPVTRDATVAALPAIVQGLRRDGYELVTVSDLLG